MREPKTYPFWKFLLGMAIVAPVFLWAYQPTLARFVHTWNTIPDYSHGFLVAPAALLFLWIRRDEFPGVSFQGWWLGALLLALAVAMRCAGALLYVDAVDGWSILLWTAGACCLLGGVPFLRWSWSSIAFLFFMVPLPFQVERALSLPLQRIAAKLSCWSFQFLGMPAFAEGNTILLGDHVLEVEQACSGLRILMGIVAVACAVTIMTRRPWWEKLFIAASIVPVALAANTLRIVATGVLYEYVSSAAAKQFSHDFAGWMMIPLAACMFMAVLWYLGQIFKEVELLNVREVVRRGRT